MDAADNLNVTGLALPSIAYVVGSLVFGVLGWAAFRRGRKIDDSVMVWSGVVLMAFPYAVTQTWLLWLIGSGLTGWLLTRWR